MRRTSIKKNKSGKSLNQKLTYNRVWLLFNLLHINVVYSSFVKWIGLLSSTPISVPILPFRALRGIVSSLPALETSNVA